MRVMMITQQMDLHTPITAFIPVWAARLAAHVDALDVVALDVGDPGPLPPNLTLHSLGKREGAGRRQALGALWRVAGARLRHTDALFVHMIPRYVLAAAPLALPARVPITLWYTHQAASRELRAAVPLVRRVVTAVPSSFPLPSPKVRALGHGIDAAFYSPGAFPAQGVSVVQVARLMRVKNHPTLVRALAQVPNARVELVGDVPPGADATYLKDVVALARDVGVFRRVRFAGALPPDRTRDVLQRAAVAVNLSPVGLFDKAALESMACGVPTLVANPAFDPILADDAPLLRLDDPEDHDALADRLAALLAMPSHERAAIGARLRAGVLAHHSLDALIPKLVRVLRTGEPN